MPAALRLLNDAQFQAVGSFFNDCGFTEANLCRLLDMKDMSDLGAVRWEALAGDKISKKLRWCLEVFVRGLPSPETESRTICGEQTFSAFMDLGLIRQAQKVSGSVVCPVWVYPVDGFVIVSDRRDAPEGGACVPEEDVVFPAIYAGTLRFLSLLPNTPVGDALDLCGGSGIGALHLSRIAGRAVSADVTARSALFAEFNARLNGVFVRSVCGDLYDPVTDAQFDLITAHPPFVPAAGKKMVYRDAGETGEEITRKLMEGLPAHLRVGGTCVVLCVGRDTTNHTFEQRVREWLGAAGAQFDIIFGLEKVLSLDGVVDSIRKRGQQISVEQANDLAARLHALGTRQFVYGVVFVRRSPEQVQAAPMRIQLSGACAAADFERVFRWRAWCRQPGFESWLASSRPCLAPGLELTVRHAVQEGQLVPAEFTFSVVNGFESALRPDGWIVPLLARLEGINSVQEVFRKAEADGDLPAGFTLHDFGDLVRRMIERGFLQVQFPGSK